MVSLLSAVSLAVMGTFIQGVKIYNRFGGLKGEEEAAFLVESLTRDLTNTVNYSLVPWVVSGQSLSFASINTAGGEELGAMNELPMQVVYRYDREKKVVTRSENGYPFDKVSAKTRVMAEGVQSLKFEVLGELQDAAPSRVTLLMMYGDEAHPRLLKKHIMVPVGYAGRKN